MRHTSPYNDLNPMGLTPEEQEHDRKEQRRLARLDEEAWKRENPQAWAEISMNRPKQPTEADRIAAEGAAKLKQRQRERERDLAYLRGEC